MVELLLRLAAAAAVIGFGLTLGEPSPDVGWKIALAFSALALVQWRLEARQVSNPGLFGFLAVADAAMLAMLLGHLGALGSLGFLVLLPTAWAAARHRSPASSMAPLAGGSLLAAHFFTGGAAPDGLLLIQTGSVMLVGLLLGAESDPAATAAEPDEFEMSDEEDGPDTRALREVRESHGKLRERYRTLERSTRRATWAVELAEAQDGPAERFGDRLAEKLSSLLRVPEVAIYSVSETRQALVPMGVSRSANDEVKDFSVAVDLTASAGQVRWKAAQILQAQAGAANVENVLLNSGGKIVGMVATLGDAVEPGTRTEALLEEASPQVARLLVESQRRTALERRTRQAELLYEVASLTRGATSQGDLAQRVVRELKEILAVDSVALVDLGDSDPICLANAGARCDLMPALRFPTGEGAASWVESGAEPVVLENAREDPRCPEEIALRLRVGSYAAEPLVGRRGPIAYLSIAAHRSHGIGPSQREALAIAAAEAAQALERLTNDANRHQGIMAPGEFQAFVAGGSGGAVVSIELVHQEQLEQRHGRPALGLALRRLAARVALTLPSGGALCRTPDLGLLAYLPSAAGDVAGKWANDAVALAALTGIGAQSGVRGPLPMRAKVSPRQDAEVLRPAA
ncbi:MAG: GAF domain-containing protein [Fimbriimonas ginsengisoli]|uniref:GAF domain-containing protein n=1 Tax=Fimbriimonas ginsengisoli TaxID=1005039 RepID=A0A931LU69_FIMGI|nr:GAF domain-containing protein [Fimbriimonas ginsengisoli]